MKKAFLGTDGERGKVGEYPITPDFMLKLAWATGKVFASKAVCYPHNSKIPQLQPSWTNYYS